MSLTTAQKNIPSGTIHRFRVTFKGISVIIDARGAGSALAAARVKLLAMYHDDSTPDEGLGDIDRFSGIAVVTPMSNR
jgi:hypothetical protein